MEEEKEEERREGEVRESEEVGRLSLFGWTGEKEDLRLAVTDY